MSTDKRYEKIEKEIKTNERRKKILDFVAKGAKVLMFFAIVLLIFNYGQVRGFIFGMATVQELNNESTCSLLSDFNSDIKEVDGYCILSNESKYSEDLNCSWGKLRTIGRKNHTGLTRFASNVRGIPVSYMIGCDIWGVK